MKQNPIAMPTVFPVTCHTDHVGKGSTFVTIDGYVENGIKYIIEAIERGAHCVVVQHDALLDGYVSEYIAQRGVIVQRVEDTRQALAQLSAQAAGFPAKKLNIIGITGTKGKTTTSFLLEHFLRAAGYKTGLISSAGNKICNVMMPPCLTTPQPDYLHQFLKLCIDNHVEYVVMEVAAQALTLHRVKDIHFYGVIFTNFSHEHLEFYPTLADYCAAKNQIFSMACLGAPLVVNLDDAEGIRIKEKLAGKNIIGYGFGVQAELAHYKGTYDSVSHTLTMYTADIDKRVLQCPVLIGQHNGYNILAASAMAYELGVPFHVHCRALAEFTGVPGRLQQINLPNGARAYIDYAHNPSSFEAILSTFRPLTDHLIVVFGAGGGKDVLKRPIMGYIASEYADLVILTSDNPRLENPETIIADICEGIEEKNRYKIVQILDREKAICQAYAYSQKGSIIAILGKGSDEYQIIGMIKYPFSEQTILQQLT